ncbi:MAG: hypothetical protein HC904_06230 [Blastochloris sp.]|nr:hypothetical protein [Blastochloris sp.]
MLRDMPEKPVQEISRVASLPVVTWFDEVNAYVLVGNDPSVRIADFL